MNHKFTIVFFFLLCNVLFSQVTETKGNLLRIDFTKPNIDFSDTLWQWTNKDYTDGGVYFACSNIIKGDSTTYLLVKSTNDNPYLPKNYLYLHNIDNKSARLLFEESAPLDNLDTYFYYKPIVKYASKGWWIFNGPRMHSIFLRNDTLYNYGDSNKLPLIHIAGNIEGKNLIVVDNATSGFNYYLENLSTSPNIQLNNKVSIVNSNDYRVGFQPLEIYHLSDSLYLYYEDLTKILYLASFSNNKLKLIKRLKPEGTVIPGQTTWKFSNNSIFYIENKKLFRECYDSNSTTFINKEIVIENVGNKYSFSGDNNYFAEIRNDTLIVYTLHQFKLINSYSISSINYRGSILIDSQYVYLHQIKTVTDVKDTRPLLDKFVLRQNYPNPFNPSTTISYEIPEAAHVELKVYDMLGREVATLADEYKRPGNYKSTFNIQNSALSSGIYFYSLRVRDSSPGKPGSELHEVKKMLLLK